MSREATRARVGRASRPRLRAWLRLLAASRTVEDRLPEALQEGTP